MARFTRAEVRRIVGEACTDEIENAIIALHLGVVDPMKDELQTAKEKADKLSGVEKELTELKANIKGGEDYKKLYEDLKSSTEKEKETSAKKAKLKELLKDIGIAEKRLDSVLKVQDLDGLKLNDKGEIENATDLKNTLKTEWSDFIATSETHGAQTPNPPASTGAKFTSKEEIMKIKDAGERQKAIAENLNLFN